eukprot:1266741-Lingulodinium_polyedra.AAC.1
MVTTIGLLPMLVRWAYNIKGDTPVRSMAILATLCQAALGQEKREWHYQGENLVSDCWPRSQQGSKFVVVQGTTIVLGTLLEDRWLAKSAARSPH